MDSELINIWTDGGGKEHREWSGYIDDCRKGLNECMKRGEDKWMEGVTKVGMNIWRAG